MNDRLSKTKQMQVDRASKMVLYEGCSVSQLGALFGLDNRTVAKKISGTDPYSTRRGFPIYRIKDVAPYLVKPAGDFESYIRNAHHSDLPANLTKEFWTGQKMKLQYEEEKGDLWRTDEVVVKLSSTFQAIRTALLLLSDGVEREVAFTDRQRDLLKDKIDQTLEECRVSLIQAFEGDNAPDESERDEPPAIDDFDDDDDEAFFFTESDDEDPAADL